MSLWCIVSIVVLFPPITTTDDILPIPSIVPPFHLQPLAYPPRDVDVMFGIAYAAIPNHHDARAQSTQEIVFLRRLIVRHDNYHPVTARAREGREGYPRRAGRPLDEYAVRARVAQCR